MVDIQRANLIYALAEVVQDAEVMQIIEEKSGNFESSQDLQALEEAIKQKVIAYRTHDLWPPKIDPITKVMNFDS
ncbi:hypothetical protein [Thalassotalea maritima]|uniref:hypothetical protein n=1 Tax=Thalassotalea maritima TaxID=3242416 RepID=UPI00352908C1